MRTADPPVNACMADQTIRTAYRDRINPALHSGTDGDMGRDRNCKWPDAKQVKSGCRLTDRCAAPCSLGSQIVAQLVTWSATFLVIRMLSPSDYGLFAMTQAMLVFLNLMNGYGFANALVRSESISQNEIRQVFGMLLLLNAGLALAQVALAPLAAAYFRQPMVAELLRVQALLYLATPFIALPQALLARRMDFKRQAQVYLLASCSAPRPRWPARAGWGVWTLVAAPIALFSTQAIGLTWMARSLVWPSFRFAGAGACSATAGAMVAVQFFWFVQSQSDVFIAGRLRRAAPARPLHHRPVPDPDPHCQVRAAAERRRLRRLFADQGPAAKRWPHAFLKARAADHADRPAFLFRPGGDRRAAGADRARPEMGGDDPAGPPARLGDAVHDPADPVPAGDQRARPGADHASGGDDRRGAACRSASWSGSATASSASPGPGWSASRSSPPRRPRIALPVIGAALGRPGAGDRARPARLRGDGRGGASASTVCCRRWPRHARLAIARAVRSGDLLRPARRLRAAAGRRRRWRWRCAAGPAARRPEKPIRSVRRSEYIRASPRLPARSG